MDTAAEQGIVKLMLLEIGRTFSYIGRTFRCTGRKIFWDLATLPSWQLTEHFTAITTWLYLFDNVTQHTLWRYMETVRTVLERQREPSYILRYCQLLKGNFKKAFDGFPVMVFSYRPILYRMPNLAFKSIQNAFCIFSVRKLTPVNIVFNSSRARFYCTIPPVPRRLYFPALQ